MPKIRERIFPQFKIHAQASGRWSTTDPPLAQLPANLRDIIMPDDGEVWVGFDYDQVELRLLAALANDAPLLEAFTNGWDIHTLNCCDFHGLPYPPDKCDPHTSPTCDAWRATVRWEGKDDTRRVFAKRFVYRLNYGGEPRTAGDIPGAKALGLTPAKLVVAARRYLAAHPALATWRTSVAEQAQKTRESRTFLGRRRRLLGKGQAVVREAFNHPLQGAVADVLNLTIVRIKQALPYATLVYTMHDSLWMAVSRDKAAEAEATMRAVVARPWNVGGVSMTFPATFKRREAA